MMAYGLKECVRKPPRLHQVSPQFHVIKADDLILCLMIAGKAYISLLDYQAVLLGHRLIQR